MPGAPEVALVPAGEPGAASSVVLVLTRYSDPLTGGYNVVPALDPLHAVTQAGQPT